MNHKDREIYETATKMGYGALFIVMTIWFILVTLYELGMG